MSRRPPFLLRGMFPALLVLLGLSAPQQPAVAQSRPGGSARSATTTTRPAIPEGLRPTTAASRPPLPAPTNLAELQSLQEQVQAVLEKAIPATVGVQVGRAQGSGVIVSPDGIVLCAAHVVQEPGKEIVLILSDGRRVKAKTLGLNKDIDSGMIQITDEGEYPYVEIGSSGELRRGEWTIATGHPGGYRRDRPPVVRLGRVVESTPMIIVTDNTLIGGDSGGPLFNLRGQVVGIHSRIGMSTVANMHVPSDSFTETWTRLASGENWGEMIDRFQRDRRPLGDRPMLGVNGREDPRGFRVTSVGAGSPAEQAGLRAGDIIASINGQIIDDQLSLVGAIARHKVGDEIAIEILRAGAQRLTLKAKLASMGQ